MLRLVGLLAVLVGSLTISGGLAASDLEGEAVVKAEEPSANKRVCKKVKPTGSHLRQRVCLKKKEWDSMEDAAREKLRNSTVGDRGGVSQS